MCTSLPSAVLVQQAHLHNILKHLLMLLPIGAVRKERWTVSPSYTFGHITYRCVTLQQLNVPKVVCSTAGIEAM